MIYFLLSIPLVLDAIPNFFPRLSFHYLFLIPVLSPVLYGLVETTELPSISFLQNTLTHCVAALLRIVDSVRRKELGRQSERRSSLMEQTPAGPAGTREEVGAKKIF